MKKVLMLGLLVMAMGLMGCSSQRTMLFNGKDLSGWKTCLVDDSATPDQVWSVTDDGVMHCVGKPNGYIRTADSYSNYKLHVEWRWVDEPTNSGVLLHATGEDQVWPICIEAQLKHESAGDIVTIQHGAAITVDGKVIKPEGDTIFKIAPKKNPCNEKEPGQWNKYDIVCLGDNVWLYVNGELQNYGTDASLTSGPICLQSEGSAIEFRNIYLESLK